MIWTFPAFLEHAPHYSTDLFPGDWLERSGIVSFRANISTLGEQYLVGEIWRRVAPECRSISRVFFIYHVAVILVTSRCASWSFWRRVLDLQAEGRLKVSGRWSYGSSLWHRFSINLTKSCFVFFPIETWASVKTSNIWFFLYPRGKVLEGCRIGVTAGNVCKCLNNSLWSFLSSLPITAACTVLPFRNDIDFEWGLTDTKA